jgi:hypothetical protein
MKKSSWSSAIKDFDPRWGGLKEEALDLPTPAWVSQVMQAERAKNLEDDDLPLRLQAKLQAATVVRGPWGFRDARPDWMRELPMSEPLHDPKDESVSMGVAQEFGSYRKAMWKYDPNVRLRPEEMWFTVEPPKQKYNDDDEKDDEDDR